MQFNDLNVDVIYETFGQFIAIDRDGPFTLMMVCTQWQDLVIKSPHMWTWITIDHSISDLEQRVRIASQLSAGLPLQITIKIPSLRLSELQSLLNHCRFLFIDRLKWYVQKEIQTAEQEINQMLLKSPSPILERIYWSEKGGIAPYYSQPLQDFLKRDNVVDLRALLEAFPTKMISHVDVDDNSIYHPIQDTAYLPSIDTPLLWEALAHLSHLTSLTISTSQGCKRRSIGHLTLPQLRNLTFEFLRQEKENLLALDILSNLRAPNIHTVSLLGIATDGMIFEVTSTLSRSMQPIHLKLCPLRTPYVGYNWAHDSAPQRPYLLDRLKHLEIVILEIFDDTAIFLIMAQTNRMVVAAHRLQFLTLDIQRAGMDFLSLLDPVSCLLKISMHWEDREYAKMKETGVDPDMEMTYPVNSTPQKSAHYDISELHQEGEGGLTGGTHQHDITVLHPINKVAQEQAVTQGQIIRSRNFRISKLTLRLDAEDVGVCFGAFGIDAIEVGTLIICCTRWNVLSPLRRGLPDPWMRSLQELDVQEVPFTYPLYMQLDSESYPAPGIHLPSLKTLRCATGVAVHLLKGHSVPQLLNLTLSVVRVARDEPEIVLDKELEQEREKKERKEEEMMREKEEKAWEDLAAVLITTDFARRPQLITLGLEFYPDWNSFLQVIELYIKGEVNQQCLQYLKLPGLPHPSILEQLVYALRGKATDDGSRLEESPSSFNPVTQHLGCEYCRKSGWVCYEDTWNGPCWRHTPEKLVTITMDTL